MGDRGQFWGEGGTTLLPHSKLVVRYTTAYHDWEHGCTIWQLGTCFFLNYFYGTPAGSLQPGIVISPTFSDYAAGIDRTVTETLHLAAHAKN